MNIKDYLTELPLAERAVFAQKVDTSVGYLSLLKGGYRRLSTDKARVYVEASLTMPTPSGGVLTLHEVRPDVWAAEPVAPAVVAESA